ncbi:MAG: endolytic transglycosylase MltG [Candidatus Shapirobacteria bacterium]|jgi:UPF0755 protein
MKYSLLLFLLIPAFLIYSFLPVSPVSSPQSITINPGDGLSLISQTLVNANLIKNRLSFYLYAKISGQASKIHAGQFTLNRHQNLAEIFDTITRGGDFEYTVTIKPGMRLEEINQLFPSQIALNPSLEGYIIPDTYRLSRRFTSEEIATKISSLSQNNSETIILASLLEREAKTRPDKQLVAGILQNRLALKMHLQIDATVQYARDSLTPPVKYWLPATKSDLKVNSPFNTYQNTGLPPRPICNPGVDSLFAAQNPTSSNYLFYISGLDSQMYYATTLDEHNQNIAKYLK